jgi:hypothetical protein
MLGVAWANREVIEDVPVIVGTVASFVETINRPFWMTHPPRGASSPARIPAQDWTRRQHTGAHWTDCTDKRPHSDVFVRKLATRSATIRTETR